MYGVEDDRRWRALAAVLLAAAGGFQAALALGAPWGRLAYGGGHPGTLPAGLRVASAAATVAYGALVPVVVRGRPTGRAGRRLLGAAAVLFGVGAVANAVSPSAPERVVWTPVAALLAVTLWRLRPGAVTSG